VSRAFIGELDLHELGSSAVRDAQESLVQRSQQLLERNAGEAVQVARPKKVPRLKSLEICWCLDNWLRHHTGQGLEQLRCVDEDNADKDPYTWVHLSLAPDQGPDMKCSYNFLAYHPEMRLNIETCDDPSHGGWCDVRGTLKKVGVWPFMLLMINAYNYTYGSTYSPSRIDQVRRSAYDWARMINPATDPLLNYWLPYILQSLGWSHREHEPGIHDVVVKLIFDDEALLRQGAQVKLCKFHGVLYRADEDS